MSQYSLSNFSILSFKENKENKEKDISQTEFCKKCDKSNHSFVLLEECGHSFCRDCVDKLYDDYEYNEFYSNYNSTIKNENSLCALFECPDCRLKIYNILYK